MEIKSFAKINLGLEIVRRLENGYHEIRTIFQSIDLYDRLKFNEIDEEKIILIGNERSIPWDSRNLIYKTAQLLKDHFSIKKGIKIEVEKNIPPGKGLGGGSSNSAMTFLALKKIWNLSVKKSELINLAKNLGADIPYFFYGGTALGLGRGDEIRILDYETSYDILLILPDFSISTKEVYNKWDELILTSKNKESKIYSFLRNKDFGSLKNELEEVVFELYPQLEDIKRELLKEGAVTAMISGSGSSVFGIYFDKEKIKRAKRNLENKGFSCIIVSPLSREEYWIENKIIAGV
ncbi:4-(cytidine 5'-diphospho)-2-C-methyl-D-erythritol kinase [Candidatus Aminicenantes bacterium AC-708-M15]|jgi:4-diphosphocytidyl-2-C-methyl-D-erythritol kinase|nr:4-(cytidine 5'-diphospho)-2-C-methyl-D-erythritol kinase [SCandidatus Aminicenantes bacterium Aminicenantia_JdfR_composite]MCP2596890.1 4-(cytidine 5'-diphospho)-2-C-methyl-D-erythritol kinase [Candidatus Aminicenantes bacterium AC-335-G13]MCP2604277.1 4-(cytidine 5'-diphospho)-2-C-methyl-D-erythritol kinase [Candidatus Aminicenantes bacterium AC-708-M15]